MPHLPIRPLPALLTLLIGGLAGLLLGFALAQSGPGATAQGSGTAAAPAPTGGAAATPKRAKLRLRNSRFGKVIFEERSGLVAYLFTSDPRDKSTCYGACAKAWPPIKTKKRPAAGSGLKRKHLRTAKRRGGGRIVTYKGRPLYFYEHDSPGTILCHDVPGFGGQWYAVGKSGNPA